MPQHRIAWALLGLCAMLAWAGEPWRQKPYTQWNNGEVAQILSDSPWAKQVRVIPIWQSQQSSNLENQPTFNRNPMAAATGTRRDDASRMEQFRGAIFFIVWNSARTVREAYLRSGVLAGKIKPEDAELVLAQEPADYEVGIAGQDMTPSTGIEENDLKQNTSLVARRSGVKLFPSQLHFRRNPEGTAIQDVVFAFPKKTEKGQPTIDPAEDSVEFSCKVGKTTLKASFDPRKMIGRNGPDL